MKAIIIAAGMGSRLGSLTSDCPKCLLPVNEKPIIGHQIEAFHANGIEDIVLIKGYCAEKLQYPAYRTYLNDNYPNNNILCSLMYAEAEMDEAFIASYSDILYTADVVKALHASAADIAIVVDMDWRKKYVGRTAHPESEAEKVAVDENGQAIELGKVLRHNENPAGEFIGLFKCSKAGARKFREAFHEARREYDGKPFFNAALFEKAYITDMMNYLISRGVTVQCVPITDGWMEIDTEQDLERARAWLNRENKEQTTAV